MGNVTVAIKLAMKQQNFGVFRLGARGFTGISAAALGAKAAVAAYTAAIVIAGAATVTALSKFIAWEEQIIRVKAVTRATGEEFEALKDKSRELGETTVFTATEVAGAMFFMGQAGLATAEILEGVNDVLNLARIGMIEMGRSADIVTDVMKSFGLTTADFTRIVDVLAETSVSATTTINQLGSAFVKVAPIAKALGVSIEETGAALAVLAEAGLKGEEGGTALRNIFIRLLNPTAESEKILTKVGISAQDVSDGLFNLTDIVLILKDALEKGTIGTAELINIFQARAGPAMLNLIGSFDEGQTSVAAFEDQLLNAGGAAQEMSDILDEATATSMKELRSIITEIFISIGEKLAPVLVDMIEVVKDNKDALDPFIARFGEMVPLFVASVIPALKGVQDIIKAIIPVVVDVFEALGPLQKVLIFLLFPLSALIPIFTKFSDEMVAIIEFLAPIAIGIAQFAGNIAFLTIEFVKFISKTKAFQIFMKGLMIIIKGAIKLFKEFKKEVQDAFPKEGFLPKVVDLFTKDISEGFGSQAGNRRITQPGLEVVHPGEIITNPALSQDVPGNGKNVIFNITNNFHLQEMDPFVIERDIKKQMTKVENFL